MDQNGSNLASFGDVAYMAWIKPPKEQKQMKDPDAGHTKWPGISQHDPHFPKRTFQYIAGSVGAIKICNLYIYIYWKYVATSWFTPIWFLFKVDSWLSTRWSKECHPMSLRFELWWRVQANGNPVGLGRGVCITWIEPTECDECASDQVAIGWNQVFAATYIFSVVYAILISVGSSKQVVVFLPLFCHAVPRAAFLRLTRG